MQKSTEKVFKLPKYIRKLGSRNQTPLSPETHNWPFLCMHSQNVAKNGPKCCHIHRIGGNRGHWERSWFHFHL